LVKEEPLAKGEPFPCRSQLINIPTGLGKTAAVVLGYGIASRARAKTGQDVWFIVCR
jgi:ERCC4-related helicase